MARRMEKRKMIESSVRERPADVIPPEFRSPRGAPGSPERRAWARTAMEAYRRRTRPFSPATEAVLREADAYLAAR